MSRIMMCICALATVSIASEPERLQFVGIIAEKGRVQVALFDPRTDETHWRPIGADYGAVKLLEYDDKNSELVMQRNGEVIRLKLKESRVLEGDSSKGVTKIEKSSIVISSSAPMEESQLKSIGGVLHQLMAAADYHFQKKGGDAVAYDELVGKNKYVLYVKSIAGEDYRGLVFTPKQTKYTVVTPSGVSVSIERK